LRRGVCGSAVGEAFEGEAKVVEDLGIVGGLGVEGGEEAEGGGEVGGGEGVVGLLDEGSGGGGFGLGLREVLCEEHGGEGGRQEQGEEGCVGGAG
jgi:hypothetical protein